MSHKNSVCYLQQWVSPSVCGERRQHAVITKGKWLGGDPYLSLLIYFCLCSFESSFYVANKLSLKQRYSLLKQSLAGKVQRSPPPRRSWGDNLIRMKWLTCGADKNVVSDRTSLQMLDEVCGVWWLKPVIPASKRRWQEEHLKFKAVWSS